jgi:uncharacterized delta-60 repeat protein
VAITFGPQDTTYALIRQPDGTLVVAGSSFSGGFMDLFLARHRPDGHADTSFGSGGKVTARFGTAPAWPISGMGLIAQPDGTLVLAAPVTVGTTPSPTTPLIDALLVRFLPDGRLDPAFGMGGAVATDLGSNEIPTALLRQPDGTLIMAGSSVIINPRNAAAIGTAFLARYQPDGGLDPTFGTGGAVTNFFGSGQLNNSGYVLARQPDGRFVVAGPTFTTPGAPVGVLGVARFLPDGRLDPTFGTSGTVTTAIGSFPGAGPVAMVVQPDGTLVVAGSWETSRGTSIELVRFRPDGRLDPTFGTGGTVSTGVGRVRALLQQPDGKLVVAILDPAWTVEDLLLARYLSDGRIDPTFGTGGPVVTDVGGRELPSALLQQPDGKLVVAGSFSTGSETDILLARYEALGCPAADPEPCLASLAAFVTDVYQAALARHPDAGEAGYWVDVLADEPSPDTVRGMLHVIFDGPEFHQRPINPWQYVEALYQAMLGRAPDPAELDWWVQAVLERVNTLLPVFLASSEFQRLVPSCQDQAAVTLLVGRLYQHVLGRVASPEELAWWTQDIMTWCALEEAVEVFFTNGEYLGVPRTLAGHVTVLYRALLAREPDTQELAWWVDDLAGQLAALEDDLMASPEFEARVYRLFP